MPLSRDPAKRSRQLANLNRGATERSPAPLGNRRTVRHGAFMTIPRDQLGDELRELYQALAEAAPLRDGVGELPVHDEAAVEIAARALKRYRSVHLWCEQYGRFEEKSGKLKAAATYELDCERALHRALDVLGMNPTSRAKLGLDVARSQSLAEAMAEDWRKEREEQGSG